MSSRILSKLTKLLTVQDCWVHDFNRYGSFGASDRLAMIGTTFERFSGSEHAVRIASGNRTYFADNTILSNDAKTSASFRGQGSGTTNERIVFVGNVVDRLAGFEPQNETSDERVSYVLIEGNTFVPNLTNNVFAAGYVGLSISARHLAIRNNLFFNLVQGVGVIAQTQLPADFIDDISIYNNTYYYNGQNPLGANPGSVLLYRTADAAHMIVRNNVYYTESNSAADQLLLLGASTNIISDHNLMFAPNVGNLTPVYGDSKSWTLAQWQAAGQEQGSRIGNPNFVSTDMSAADGFRLQAGSMGIDMGTTVPALSDLVGAARPQGSSWDVGAFEHAP